MSDELASTDNRAKNQALVTYVVLPFIFLTVALLGGLRVNSESHVFMFLPPALITLVLAVLLLLLFVRGGLIEIRSLIAAANPPSTNVAHIWMLLTLFRIRAGVQFCITGTWAITLAILVLFSLDALEQSVFILRRAPFATQSPGALRNRLHT